MLSDEIAHLWKREEMWGGGVKRCGGRGCDIIA